MTEVPTELIELMRSPSTCYLATTMPNGSPQLTQMWVDTDGQHVIVKTPRRLRGAAASSTWASR